ncbi:MAG: hypothetical protein ACO1O3_08235 [Sphingobium sp.]
MKSCPMCGNDAENSASTCSCGYSFAGKVPDGTASSRPLETDQGTGHGMMRSLGIIMFMLGLCVMGYAAFIFDPSLETPFAGSDILPDRLNNLGLMQRQTMLFILGGVGVCVGSVVWTGGAICAALEKRIRR